MKINKRYLPKSLTRKDRKNQGNELIKSRKLYRRGVYHIRPKFKSFKTKKSKHIINAQKIYNINKISPSNKLAKATGCSKSALSQIVNKGQGAYYSSGSRPNQTPQSWGIARLASSITSGKSAVIDYNILEKGCKTNSKALLFAKKAREKYGNGTRRAPKVQFGGNKEEIITDSFFNVVNIIKNITIDSNINYEKCGIIKKNKDYIIEIHKMEILDINRKNCTNEYYDKIIWHSHPKNGKFYPSLEDLLKIIKLKNRQIIFSYIFTEFGFWTLKSIQHVEIDEKLPKKINKLLDKLYFKTERGRTYIKETVDNFIHNINELLNGILEISFTLYII